MEGGERSQHAKSMVGRSEAMKYEPTLQERTQVAMKGRLGLCWEAANFAVSILVFAVYVLEVCCIHSILGAGWNGGA